MRLPHVRRREQSDCAVSARNPALPPVVLDLFEDLEVVARGEGEVACLCAGEGPESLCKGEDECSRGVGWWWRRHGGSNGEKDLLGEVGGGWGECWVGDSWGGGFRNGSCCGGGRAPAGLLGGKEGEDMSEVGGGDDRGVGEEFELLEMVLAMTRDGGMETDSTDCSDGTVCESCCCCGGRHGEWEVMYLPSVYLIPGVLKKTNDGP